MKERTESTASQVRSARLFCGTNAPKFSRISGQVGLKNRFSIREGILISHSKQTNEKTPASREFWRHEGELGPKTTRQPVGGQPVEELTIYKSSHICHPLVCSTAPEGCLPKIIGDSECAVGSYSFICFSLAVSRSACAVIPEDGNSVLINETK